MRTAPRPFPPPTVQSPLDRPRSHAGLARLLAFAVAFALSLAPALPAAADSDNVGAGRESGAETPPATDPGMASDASNAMPGFDYGQPAGQPRASRRSSRIAPPDAPQDAADMGLLIEGDIEQRRRLGQMILDGDPREKVLYEDDHHRVVGSARRPAVRIMYRHDPTSSEWLYYGSMVRGQPPRGSNFGWSVAVQKPYMAVLDWSSEPLSAALVIYEKTPHSLRGWKKRYEVLASNAEQTRCMRGLEAETWLTRWLHNRGEDCGVRTIDSASGVREGALSLRGAGAGHGAPAPDADPAPNPDPGPAPAP